MDGSKFDALARALGHGVSRRKALRGIAGGLAGVLAGGVVARKDAGAAARNITICHATGDPNAPYQSLTIPQAEMNLHARHGDFVRIECCANDDCADQYGACGSGTCQGGYCVQLPVAAGTSCDDGSYCNGDASCDGAFNCVGGNPIVCAETENPCTTAVCSEAEQGCQEVPLDDGTTCGASDACTSYTCLSGSCIGHALTNCAGTCADCSGECVDLHGDLDNCGTCGQACEDLGLCLTTTCVPPGICLNTPVNCPGGDQCHTAACNPDTGCYLQTNTGASCTTAGSNIGTCGEDGACHPICPAAATCSGSGDCDENQTCWNGACFSHCGSSGGNCNTECATCYCSVGPDFNPINRICADTNNTVGDCFTDADCPSGSYCNPNTGSGAPGEPHSCTRPCPQPQVPS